MESVSDLAGDFVGHYIIRGGFRRTRISLSAFGPGGPFSFGPFSDKFKKQQHKKPNKQHSGDSSKHEAVGDEWLKTGHCPIAKSYNAASKVMPLVAKALQPPHGMRFRCPAPMPLPEKMLAIALMGMAANIPLGFWREHTIKFSPSCCSCCWRSFSISEALKQREPFSMTIPGRADIIPKLNGFFTTYFPSEAIRAISQKADFLCKARIVSVWSPVSCTGCSRKLENYVTSLRCNRCVSPNVTGPMQSWSLMMEKTLQRLWFLIPRCLTHQNESSDTSSGGGLVSTINKPFIYRFQILITTLYNTPIFNQKQIKGVGGPKLPRCLKELAGNQYVFPQTCTFNFTFNHRTFTGSSITEDILLDPLTVGRRPHRTSTESASETGGPSGKAKEVDDPNLPSLAEIEKSRKHPA
uniref:Uncharacterized protein n=1 Tax=Brassica oleracea TaxID=3712 RepID=A0A3P6FD00_BRAOL|nr:unnamed protein product [Brassica oleracea]